MMVMIERCQTAIGRFSGFPAASLPRLRFDRRVAFKVLIRKDFLSRVETRKNFFPERQGKGGGGATLLSFALLRARRGSLLRGYCLFEVPSNLVPERVGARFWIARRGDLDRLVGARRRLRPPRVAVGVDH